MAIPFQAPSDGRDFHRDQIIHNPYLLIENLLKEVLTLMRWAPIWAVADTAHVANATTVDARTIRRRALEQTLYHEQQLRLQERVRQQFIEQDRQQQLQEQEDRRQRQMLLEQREREDREAQEEDMIEQLAQEPPQQPLQEQPQEQRPLQHQRPSEQGQQPLAQEQQPTDDQSMARSLERSLEQLQALHQQLLQLQHQQQQQQQQQEQQAQDAIQEHGHAHRHREHRPQEQVAAQQPLPDLVTSCVVQPAVFEVKTGVKPSANTLTLRVELCRECYQNGRQLKVVGVSELEHNGHGGAGPRRAVDNRLPENNEEEPITVNRCSKVKQRLISLLQPPNIDASLLTAVIVIVGWKMFIKQ